MGQHFFCFVDWQLKGTDRLLYIPHGIPSRKHYGGQEHPVPDQQTQQRFNRTLVHLWHMKLLLSWRTLIILR